MTAFRTGTTGATTTTIPATVAAGDVMLLAVNAFSNGTSPVVSVSSTGTAFTQIGGQQAGGTASGFTTFGAIFYAVASATDAGKVITASATGGGTLSFATALAAYSGASNSAPIDVSGGAASGTSPLAFPAETTGVSGDWAIYLSPFSESAGNNFTGPAGTTQREANEPSFGVGCGIWDSNGSVGGAGTGIGGASFTISSTAGSVWLTAFTVGLAPPSTGINGTVQPRAAAPAPRRRPGRAVIAFTPVATVNAPAGVAPQQHPQTVYRRRPARAYARFTPVATTNFIPVFVAVAAPRQPAAFPRRRLARAYTQFTPVATVNAPPPPPRPPSGLAFSDEAREFKRWLLWEV